MRFKGTANIILISLLVLSMVPAAGAMTVTLDAVENAGWWEENLEQSYLKIFDADNIEVWSGGNSDLMTSWTDFAALVDDLDDGYIGAAGSGTSLGSTYTIQSGGNVFSAAAPIYTTIRLSAGQYTISLDSDSESYNLKGYSDSNYAGDNLWNAYVQMWVPDGQNLAFGDGNTLYGNSAEALSAYDTITVSLELFGDTDLNLYINDYNSLDNTGSVTLNIQPVPLPAAWLLFGSGMAALAGGRRLRKNGVG
jgi:hypothetical protein